jgi:hypothetical protein
MELLLAALALLYVEAFLEIIILLALVVFQLIFVSVMLMPLMLTNCVMIAT